MHFLTLSNCFSVSPAWAEPVEGWVDSLNGPIGIMVGKYTTKGTSSKVW